MTRPGLTYWRCPECPRFVVWTALQFSRGGWIGVVASLPNRDDIEAAERLVEAHEARHGIGAA